MRFETDTARAFFGLPPKYPSKWAMGQRRGRSGHPATYLNPPGDGIIRVDGTRWTKRHATILRIAKLFCRRAA